jgi:2-oxoglutarate ferredoxin oxidoreductase subunit alpha
MMQAKWGSHGDYEIIALSPASPQEFFDLTIRAFNLAEKYRTPVLLMADAEVGHMTEKVVIPEPHEVTTIDRPLVRRGEIEPDLFRIYRDMKQCRGNACVSPMALAGSGFRFHVTGLTHDERGYPDMSAEGNAWNVARIVNKIRDNLDDIIMLEEQSLADADVAVISYGISARTALWPIQLAREEGLRVGLLRLITVWPFPEARLKRLTDSVRALVVCEINMGQVVKEVQRCAAGRAQVYGVHRPGGAVLDPAVVLDTIRQAAGRAT